MEHWFITKNNGVVDKFLPKNMMLTVLHPLFTLELDGFRHLHMLEYNNLNEFEYFSKKLYGVKYDQNNVLFR
jgi:hypothetical protein